MLDRGRRSEAEAELRKAVDLKPDLADAHNNLGKVLFDRGERSAAEAELRKAIELNPGLADGHYFFGILLKERGVTDGAESEFRKAIQLKPGYPEAHNFLGLLLYQRGEASEAEKEYRKAVELRPGYPEPHNNLGLIFRKQGKPAEAETEYRKAVELRPGYANANLNLVSLLNEEGRFPETLAAAKHWRDAMTSADPQRERAVQEVRACEQLIERDARLPAVLRGEDKPSAAELADFGRLCLYKRLNVAAARLYTQAFAADAKLAERVRPSNRFYAACAAALAGAGQGDDAGQVDDKGRAELRGQAVVWLRAELAAWAGRLKDDPKAVAEARRALSYFKTTSDLASLRDADAVDKLPDDERDACHKLWADVDALLRRASAAPNP